MESSKNITMKIKLIESGGFIPLTKEAVAEVDWTPEECEKILGQIAVKQDKRASLKRDAIDHTIEIGSKEIPVDLENLKGPHKEVFNKLRSDLKIVKT